MKIFDVYDRIFKIIGPGSTVLDIGANKGDHSYQFYLHGARYLHSFEPDPAICTLLGARMRKYAKIDVFSPWVHNYGIGDQAGELTFYRTQDSINSSFIKPDAWVKPTGEELKIEVTTLDNVVKHYDIKHIDFLKVDTQGYDLNVIKGGLHALTMTRFVCFEMVLVHMYEEARYIAEFEAYLKPLGFRLYSLSNVNYNNTTAQISHLDMIYVRR